MEIMKPKPHEVWNSITLFF